MWDCKGDGAKFFDDVKTVTTEKCRRSSPPIPPWSQTRRDMCRKTYLNLSSSQISYFHLVRVRVHIRRCFYLTSSRSRHTLPSLPLSSTPSSSRRRRSSRASSPEDLLGNPCFCLKAITSNRRNGSWLYSVQNNYINNQIPASNHLNHLLHDTRKLTL